MTMPGQFQPQYPPTPQFQGSAVIPPTVRRAVLFMRVGALIKALEIVLSLSLNTTGLSTLSSAWLGGVIAVGLWLWMAAKCAQGCGWARVTGTVFFGFACLGLLTDIYAIHIVSANFTPAGLAVPAALYLLIACDIADWLVGLFTTALLWQKSSGLFFNPPMAYAAGWGVPGAPFPYPAPYQQAPYQQAPYPQGLQASPYSYPGQSGPVPGAPAEPADPWASPPE
jgi:hypothetical protein